jgi:predicted esterase
MHAAMALVSFMAISTVAIAQPELALNRLDKLVDPLLKLEQPPLFAWHLRSLKGLAHSEFSKLILQVPQSARTPVATREKEFVEFVTAICDGLERDCSKSEPYLKEGQRGLVLARPSSIDGSLQYFMVDLPKDWDPKKPYPLFVGLHGSGPENPLAYPSYGFGPLSPHVAGAPERATAGMIRLAPWGRGNRGWRNDAERDLFEAIASVQSFATLDPDRWYITGHSSGADGCWAIIQHTPDLWAAAGLQSGSMLSGRPEWGLVSNLANLPVHIIIGENDNLPYRIPDSKEAYRLLKELGAPTKLAILPGIGHYPLDPVAMEDHEAWIVSHRRVRPKRFSFVVDQSTHPGIWGISVVLDAQTSRFIKEPWPRFDCTIDGQSVHIKSANVKELKIDLGPNGLKMTGKVSLAVNGKVVHEGEVPAGPLSVPGI